jgi:hypothetical protein
MDLSVGGHDYLKTAYDEYKERHAPSVTASYSIILFRAHGNPLQAHLT